MAPNGCCARALCKLTFLVVFGNLFDREGRGGWGWDRSGGVYSHVHTHTHKHFPVRWNGKEFSFGVGKFSTVKDLIDHFESKPVVGGESGTSGDT